MPPEPTPPNTPPTPPAPPPTDDLAGMKAELEALRKEKAQWSQDPSLSDKLKKEQEDRDRKNSDSKSLESAIMFNMTSSEFLKTNESLLPKEVAEIFKLAERENYSNAVDRANATKSAIIQSFFSQQSNLEMLTPSQQSTLAEYLKLTKNGKEEKAREIYDNLFEPALASLKRVKKAEELFKAKQGFGGNTDADQAYKDKMSNMAKTKFFRGKK